MPIYEDLFGFSDLRDLRGFTLVNQNSPIVNYVCFSGDAMNTPSNTTT